MNVSVAIETRIGAMDQDRCKYIATSNRTVLVLADGAGGVAGGTEAAEQVLRAADGFAEHQYKSALDTLYALDHSISRIGGMTTAVLVEAFSGYISGASVGDSVAWLLGSEGGVDLTQAQYRKPLLGDGAIPVAFGPTQFNGRLLIASDGLVKYVGWETIVQVARIENIWSAAKALVELPRLRSGSFPDDVAVILAETHL